MRYVVVDPSGSFNEGKGHTGIAVMHDEMWDEIGVRDFHAKNYEKRFRQYYHGLQYKEPKILYTAKRFEIAEIEYKVKKQFLKKVVLGTETYSINDLEEIMEYINSLINNPCN